MVFIFLRSCPGGGEVLLSGRVCLPSIYKDLDSIPSTTKRKKGKKKTGENQLCG